jgi:hypothetical protein
MWLPSPTGCLLPCFGHTNAAFEHLRHAHANNTQLDWLIIQRNILILVVHLVRRLLCHEVDLQRSLKLTSAHVFQFHTDHVGLGQDNENACTTIEAPAHSVHHGLMRLTAG